MKKKIKFNSKTFMRVMCVFLVVLMILPILVNAFLSM